MDHLIPCRKPDQDLIIKERETNTWIFRAEKKVEHWGDCDIIVIGVFETVPKSWENKLKELEIRGKIDTIQTTDRSEY